MGHVGADPQNLKFKTGKSKTTFSIGINIGKDTTWIEAECWDKLSENMEKFLSKGQLVYAEGKLKQSTWKTKEGYLAKKTICACDYIKIISQNKEDSPPTAQSIPKTKDLKNQQELEEAPW